MLIDELNIAPIETFVHYYDNGNIWFIENGHKLNESLTNSQDDNFVRVIPVGLKTDYYENGEIRKVYNQKIKTITFTKHSEHPLNAYDIIYDIEYTEYKDGRIFEIGTYKNAIFHLSQYASFGLFTDMPRSGELKRFFPNGKILSIETYSNDEIYGIIRWFHENGNIKCFGSMENSVKVGEWTCFFENGEIKSKGHYKNDQMVGEWILFNEERNREIVVYTYTKKLD